MYSVKDLILSGEHPILSRGHFRSLAVKLKTCNYDILRQRSYMNLLFDMCTCPLFTAQSLLSFMEVKLKLKTFVKYMFMLHIWHAMPKIQARHWFIKYISLLLTMLKKWSVWYKMHKFMHWHPNYLITNLVTSTKNFMIKRIVPKFLFRWQGILRSWLIEGSI